MVLLSLRSELTQHFYLTGLIPHSRQRGWVLREYRDKVPVRKYNQSWSWRLIERQPVCVRVNHSCASLFSCCQSLTSFCPCLFKNVHRSHRWAVVTTMTPPSFFLLVWLLRTVISAFPEEPGPLNFIPTEGDDLLTFAHTLACIPGWWLRTHGCWIMSGGVRVWCHGQGVRGHAQVTSPHTHTHTQTLSLSSWLSG